MTRQLNYQVFERFPELETSRLLLRESTLADTPATFAIRSNADVLHYMDSPAHQSIKDAEKMIRRSIGNFGEEKSINWIITTKDQNDMIGYIGFWRLIPQHVRAEIGYALHPDHWGQGLMSEAMKAVLDWAFQVFQLHSIEANINQKNEASRRLLERFGFQQEAHFRENYYFDGQFIDSVIYGLTAGDYFQTKA